MDKKKEKENLEPVLEELKGIFDEALKYIKTVDQLRVVNLTFWNDVKSITISPGNGAFEIKEDIKSSVIDIYEKKKEACYDKIAHIVKLYKEKDINIISEYYDALDSGSDKWKCDIIILTRILPKVLKYEQ